MSKDTHRVDPDFNPSDADIRTVVDLLTRAAIHAPMHYHENGNGKFQKWMLGLMGLLVAMAVGGGVVMYGKVMALEAKVDAMQIQVANIQKLLEPRFRGAVHEYDYGIYHASPSLR